MKLNLSLLAALCASLLVSACASQDPEAIAQNDPWEPTNRAVFDFDIKLDHAVARPTDTFGRFMINSTVGVAGLVDVAAKMGIPGHDNDFGITLGKAGAAEGSYLVLPFVGPKPPRDLVGTGVDIAFDPLTYMSWNNSTLYMIIRGGLGVLTPAPPTSMRWTRSNGPRSISTPRPAAFIARIAPPRSTMARRPTRICRTSER